ncbi:hypothetical protein H5162_03745 [Pseudoalteromonas sp. SR41-8]|uniref:hypothetical protein n=1 Tax=Pseudoalteromonas sp. SR41-8 TaxID=2760946 RepID=UPI0015FF1BA4|nr:hypothetical protein [Pseudoalteromonas sp. SR41-8]MBB1308557.1 hypothetical protein [Pseudoalteromonas sp. SR41-8]
MTEHNEDLCIGVATFQIDGETKQFGLTKDDLDFLKEREVKLQERIDQASKHLKHFSEERVKLERQLAVIRQPEASFQAKD